MNEFLRSLLQGDRIGAPTAESVLLSLLVAFLLGQLVAWVYIWTYRGLSGGSSRLSISRSSTTLPPTRCSCTIRSSCGGSQFRYQAPSG